MPRGTLRRAIIAILLILAVSSPRCSRTRDMKARKGGPRKQLLQVFKYALYQYEAENGQIPHDPDGTAAALYKLRPFIDLRSLPQVNGRPDLEFDAARATLVNNPFDYLNQPATRLEELSVNTVVIAEKDACATGGQWLLLADGLLTFAADGRHVAGELHDQ